MRYHQLHCTCMEATTFEWFLQLGDPKMSYIFWGSNLALDTATTPLAKMVVPIHGWMEPFWNHGHTYPDIQLFFTYEKGKVSIQSCSITMKRLQITLFTKKNPLCGVPRLGCRWPGTASWPLTHAIWRPWLGICLWTIIIVRPQWGR